MHEIKVSLSGFYIIHSYVCATVSLPKDNCSSLSHCILVQYLSVLKSN